MPYETLPTAQQAIDDHMDVIAPKGKLEGYVCSNCAKGPDTGNTLKLCGKCKLTRYCSTECQKTHWRHHKFSCRLGAGDVERDVPAEYLAQKLAEHLMRVPWLMTLIDIVRRRRAGTGHRPLKRHPLLRLRAHHHPPGPRRLQAPRDAAIRAV
ncbi:hypothetical protein DFH09DRAFT_466642 [Mycena vulgaris]|nr:hypothetical protein DFH09DRAFT_466642 [Mycena vulgaris]